MEFRRVLFRSASSPPRRPQPARLAGAGRPRRRAPPARHAVKQPLPPLPRRRRGGAGTRRHAAVRPLPLRPLILLENRLLGPILESFQLRMNRNCAIRMERGATMGPEGDLERSEEHTSELQSLMRNSYAVFCL